METTNTELKKRYDVAAAKLGELCSKYLDKGWNIPLNKLVIYHKSAIGMYKGKPVNIRFVEDRHRFTGELVLSFCCDAIPPMHSPVRMLVTDGSEVRVAYYEMFNAYEEYTYQHTNRGVLPCTT